MTRNRHGISISILFWLLLSPCLLANEAFDPRSPNWIAAKKSDRLTIYTATYPASNFEAFKAEALLNQPLANIAAAISNPDSCPRWVNDCLASKNLDISSFNERYGYALSHLPWPFSNRDIIVRINTRSPKGKQQIHISMHTDDNRFSIEETDAVRITQSRTLYILEAVSKQQTRVTWMQHTEPAGALPAWLVNQKIIELPEKSLPKLEQLAAQPRYQQATLQFDSEENIRGIRLQNGEQLNQPQNKLNNNLNQ